MTYDAPVRRRPDPRPARLMLGIGTVAAVSVMASGMVRFPSSGTSTAELISDPGTDAVTATTQRVDVRHVVRYIHLKPGEKAPPGATVIDANAPAPRVVVDHVAAPAPKQAPPRVIVRTRQSGRP